MKADKDGNIVSHNVKGELARIPKDDVKSMDTILKALRDSNQDKKMWDKLSDASLEETGFNDFYHKDSK